MRTLRSSSGQISAIEQCLVSRTRSPDHRLAAESLCPSPPSRFLKLPASFLLSVSVTPTSVVRVPRGRRPPGRGSLRLMPSPGRAAAGPLRVVASGRTSAFLTPEPRSPCTSPHPLATRRTPGRSHALAVANAAAVGTEGRVSPPDPLWTHPEKRTCRVTW